MTATELPAGLQPGGRFDEWQRAPVRYVVADVDGTLVGLDGRPSPAVAAATRRLAEAGIPVGFATGRMRLAVAPLQDQLELAGPHVLHNGAEVRADQRTIAAWPLKPAEVAAILAMATSNGAYVELYDEDGFWVSAADERARPHWQILGREPLGVITDAADLDGPVFKATFVLFAPQDVAPIAAAVAELDLSGGPASSPITPDLRYVNVTRPAVEKGRALASAAEHLEVPLANVMAIGDAGNDLPMLARAGTAVAMGQADDEVRAAAHLVAPTVEKDGAATAMTLTTGD